ERGAVAPYLFDLRGQTTLRTTEKIYIPMRPIKDPLDWDSVQRDYDCVWVYDFPSWTPQLTTMGKMTYAGGNLRLYQLPRKPSRARCDSASGDRAARTTRIADCVQATGTARTNP